jgi:hypothetical protein
MLVTILEICLIIPFLGMLWSVIMLRRNQQVYAYRTHIGSLIAVAAQDDLVRQRPWEWRYEAYEKGPSYNDMMRHFWRKLDSFYPDKAFITIGDGRILK